MVIERFKNHEAIPGLPALPGKRPDDTERSSLRGKLVGTNFDRCFQLKVRTRRSGTPFQGGGGISRPATLESPSAQHVLRPA